ncbi:unnamed protein product [Caenorhabditis angaria]|uniref:DUF1248 domain-containing protein n=1 Tax=Caenorhabditis angaria TaxID=860376 RepID=A0A9P1IMQ6_9PELO|nr:unnamed protein product [Caenorhabditis angaria]
MIASRIFQRSLSTKPIITRDTVKLILNPPEKYIDEFMLTYGNRPDFRRSDFKIWNQHPKFERFFYTPKDSTKLIATCQLTFFPHVHKPSEQLSFGGLFWITPEYRGKEFMKIMQKDLGSSKSLGRPFKSSLVPSAMKFGTKLVGGQINEHFKYNVTYYLPEDLKIPKDLKSDGISVKNFDESQSQKIVEYDQKIFPYKREKLMLANFSDPNNIVKIAYDSEGNVIGFGYLALFDSGFASMYALYADNVNVARAIFANILKDAPMQKIKRFEIRQPDTSEKWIQPFVVNEQETKHMATLVSTEDNIEFNMNKIFINSHPACCPV